VNRALYAKKGVSGGQVFSRQIIMDEDFAHQFPEFFSLATIFFFMSGEYLVDHSGFF